MTFHIDLALKLSDGTTITADKLDLIIIDHASLKVVLARLHPALRPLFLWRGHDYDEAGEWTQEQAEARVLELLGENQQETLQSMVVA